MGDGIDGGTGGGFTSSPMESVQSPHVLTARQVQVVGEIISTHHFDAKDGIFSNREAVARMIADLGI